MVALTEGHGIEEGASLDMRGYCSDFLPSKTAFSMLASWLKVKSELSRLTLIQEASLKDGDGGARNSAAADFTEVLRQ
jgi:hypothetical protein